MNWVEAVILGLLQGLTEFLPVSSSAHLRIAGIFLPAGADPGAAFTAITQIGTEAAVLIYFRRDILRIASAWLRQVVGIRSYNSTDARMGWLVIIGTVPIVALGLLFKDAIESSLRNLYITAAMLIFFAIVLGAVDRFGLKRRTLDKLTWKDGVLFGLAQAMALIPGVSRSGGTISAGLAMGYTREAAARYSFLLAIPAVLGAGFYQLFKSWGEAGAVSAGPTALATLIAFASGYCVIVAFLKLVSTRSYLPFVYYRLVLGALLLGLLWSGQINPT
jgi:undecaprenyl-diphosphatase